MDVIFRRIVMLAAALGLTWMVFFGANYFGAVWTHYFSGEPEQKNTSEVSVKLLSNPTAGNGLCDPQTRQCSTGSNGPARKPHD